MAGFKVENAWLKTNSPLLVINDNVNTYVLRRKVSGVHWEEAVEQLQVDPKLKDFNTSMGIDRMIISTLRESHKLIEKQFDLDGQALNDFLTCFVSWDLGENRPKLMVDAAGAYFESIWLA